MSSVNDVIKALDTVAREHGHPHLYDDSMPVDARLEKLFHLVADTKTELTVMQRRRLFVAFDKFLDEIKENEEKAYVLNGEKIHLTVLPYEKLSIIVAHIGLTLHGSA